jgi:hypothetical protein
MVLEIALGVVVGGVLLAFLPMIIAAAGVVIVAALALLAIALVLYFASEFWAPVSVIAAIIAAPLAIYAYIRRDSKAWAIKDSIAAITDQIARRKSNGYDTSDLDSTLQAEKKRLDELLTLRAKQKSMKKRYATESERRKALGYDE